jgi:hypothetical protein
MALCPVGHESATTDYCDRCGRPIDPPAPVEVAEPVELPHEPELSAVTEVRRVEPPGAPCPECREPRRAEDRYCEGCGYDFEAGTSVGREWRATVATDRARFDALHPDDLVLPDDAPSWTVTLDTPTVTVGRRSPKRGIEPDIDLGGEYEDPGISRQHLRFQRTDDGGYAVVDCGSANGTTVNDDPTRIPADTPVALAHGDRVHLGAWTTITIEHQVGGPTAG